MKYIKLFLIIFIAFILFQGCGKKEGQSDSQAPSKEQSNAVQSSSEQIETGQATLEMKQGLPEDYPKDVPLPENVKKIKFIDNSSNKIVILETDVSVQNTINFYKENMKKNGYELDKNQNLVDSENVYNADWKKDKKTVNVAISSQNNITNVVISY
ncbi:MAG: hypothetical protein N2490_08395 [Ignavibacteria bacterium]|nr:hypothetical protein [Ignavibacteria bacterium]